MSDIAETVKVFFVSLVILAIVDRFFASFFKARYFVLHVVANFFITIFCIPDLIFVFTDPMNALKTSEANMVPLGIVYSIHVYHMVGPGFKLHFVDWLHHILMVVLGCPAMMLAGVGPISNFNFFFICGVPGGIDYFMLVQVKEKNMLPMTEKRINRLLNLWCRTPFLIATSTLFFLKTHMDIADPSVTVTGAMIAVRAFCILLNSWNALYFMDRVVGSFYVWSHKLSADFKKAKALPHSESRVKLAELRRSASTADLRKPLTVDGIHDHPLPSVPGNRRAWKSFTGPMKLVFDAMGS